MKRVNISTIKNKLSYYISLVKEGERVEILDRNNKVAEIIPINHGVFNKKDKPLMQEMEKRGIVRLPEGKYPIYMERLQFESKVSGVLDALLKEREEK